MNIHYSLVYDSVIHFKVDVKSVRENHIPKTCSLITALMAEDSDEDRQVRFNSYETFVSF